jgi:hypothetical protein
MSSIEDVTENNDEVTSIRFSCPRSGDGAQTTISVARQGSLDLLPIDNSPAIELADFIQSGDGLTITSADAIIDFEADIFLPEGQTVQLRNTDGEISVPLFFLPCANVPTKDTFGNEDTPRRTPTMTISDANGLSTVLNIMTAAEFEQIRVILYTELTDTEINGFFLLLLLFTFPMQMVQIIFK